MQLQASIVPRPTPFFTLQFALTVIHGSGRAMKKGMPGRIHHVSDVRWTPGGHRGVGPTVDWASPRSVHRPVG